MEPVKDSEHELIHREIMKVKSGSRRRANKTDHAQQLNVPQGDCCYFFSL